MTPIGLWKKRYGPKSERLQLCLRLAKLLPFRLTERPLDRQEGYQNRDHPANGRGRLAAPREQYVMWHPAQSRSALPTKTILRGAAAAVRERMKPVWYGRGGNGRLSGYARRIRKLISGQRVSVRPRWKRGHRKRGVKDHLFGAKLFVPRGTK
jgi:hypothetical protein